MTNNELFKKREYNVIETNEFNFATSYMKSQENVDLNAMLERFKFTDVMHVQEHLKDDFIKLIVAEGLGYSADWDNGLGCFVFLKEEATEIQL